MSTVDIQMFRDRFWGTLLLSIPTLVWAMTIQHWFGYAAPGGAAAILKRESAYKRFSFVFSA